MYLIGTHFTASNPLDWEDIKCGSSTKAGYDPCGVYFATNTGSKHWQSCVKREFNLWYARVHFENPLNLQHVDTAVALDILHDLAIRTGKELVPKVLGKEGFEFRKKFWSAVKSAYHDSHKLSNFLQQYGYDGFIDIGKKGITMEDESQFCTFSLQNIEWLDIGVAV